MQCFVTVERPTWTPPQWILLHVVYDAMKPYLNANDEVEGGIIECSWKVVAVLGAENTPQQRDAVALRLMCETDFNGWVQDKCLEDFAHR